MNPFTFIGSLLLGNLSKSLVDNLFWKTNEPIRGSIVYCDLAFGTAEHSGIYIGNNQIIHKNSDGLIELVSIREFLMDTSAITIYISCDKSGLPVGLEEIANEAEIMLGAQETYSLLNHNCHKFSSYCTTGDYSTNTFTLSQLKRDARIYIGAYQWRAWDLNKR